MRRTFFVCLAYATAVLVLLPFATTPWPELPGLSPLFSGGIVVTELSTALLLLSRFYQQRTLSLLLLASAYSYSGLMVLPHLLTLPGGLLAGQSALGTSAQSPAWIFLAWMLGYALLSLFAVAAEGRWLQHPIPPSKIARAAATATAAPVILVLIITVLAVRFADNMPPLLDANGWTQLNKAGTLLILLSLACAIGWIYRLDRRDEIFSWLSVALVAILAANILS